MKLVEIGKDFNSYINIDYLVRVWKENNKYYCQLLTGMTYQIGSEAFNQILEYDKKPSK